MRRTTIFLQEKLLRQLQSSARKQGVSFAAVVREALAEYVAAPKGARHMPSVAGKFSSGFSDTAERADDLLWQDPHS